MSLCVPNFEYLQGYILSRTVHTNIFRSITARSELRKVVFVALSVTFLFVHKISPELLNGFAPNSQGRRVWSLRSPGTKNSIFGNYSSLHAVYV